MRTNKTIGRTAALLAALTLAPPLWNIVTPHLQDSSWGTSVANAQPRMGDPDWSRGRNSRRANHYRDSDLTRLSWITVRGEITDDPERDYFEFRSDSGDRYRVLARPDVSLRGLDEDDRVEVYGKRDGDILIAYRVRELNDDDDDDDNGFRTTVVDNLPGNRFTIRHRYTTRIVVAERGEPNGLRAGSEVELEGRWRGNTFYASSVRLRNGGWDNDWQDGQNRRIRGIATSDLDDREFTLRVERNRTIKVSTKGSQPFKFSRGDELELWGKWDRSDNVFKVSSGRVVRDNDDYDDDRFNNGDRVDFEGTITKSNRLFNAWFYTVRTRRGRDVTVRYNREFRVGDRVEVKGTVQNNVVIASDMDRDN